MSEQDFLVYLDGIIAENYGGSLRLFAEAHGISPSYLSDIRAGHRAPGDKLLKAMGVRKVVLYELD